ncbi:variant erythrocyte surface antigen-1 family protein [Babesia caballi]|uniref:Variant erythrocyte surface antigen-1 family protein n=1 Tax=Babesia caballi TaxID=5871 RepID=A0AAV4LM98_BABCB|nr:variant erythrocyte surface antigen-1 family protein [Babesia caballi]
MAKKLTDCPSNLKEAIDWILRVTGKDGQGSDNTRALAKAVKELLQSAVTEVESSRSTVHKNGSELQRLKQGLERAKELVEKDVKVNRFETGPIRLLSRSLGRFIGYDDTVFSGRDGQIIGAGIAPSNMATHRLCDAAIAFTIAVLEGCKKHSDLKESHNINHLENVDEALKKLYEKYGSGPAGLKAVASSVANNLNEVKGSNVGGFVKPLGTAFNTHLGSIQTGASSLATAVERYLKAVFKSNNRKGWGSSDADGVDGKLQTLVTTIVQQNAYNTQHKEFNKKVGDVGSQIKTNGTNPGYLKPILEAGKQAFIWQLEKGNYKPTNYETNVQSTSIKEVHAKIFLGCLPFIFNNLSYFYWQCREGGAWQNQNITGGPLGPFMEGHWFRNSYMNENMTGTSVVRNVLDKNFEEFKTAASANSYSDFLKEFRSKGQQTWHSTPSVNNSNYLSGIYILCSCYFQCQQIKVADKASRSPQTIREIIYFIAALHFSPHYDAFHGYVTSHFQTITGKESSNNDFDLTIQVADSSKTSNGTDTLSAADLKSYLTSTFHLAPAFIGLLQGSSTYDDPWLHRLFANSEFSFRYPSSGAALFYALADYTYALQFQLSFLYKQCEYSYDNGCGWFYCKYGNNVQVNGVKSHLCTQEDGDCSSTGSPLQAFLTDNLPGLCRKHPGTSSHLATCSGYLCHVPMGFKSDQLRTENKLGGHIVISLKPFCGSSTTPLRQLCGTLTCLSKRAPRSLSDLFGFYWQVTGQLFNKLKTQDKTPTLDNALSTLLQKLSTVGENLLYASLTENVKAIGRHFFGLSWHCHKKSGWQTVKRTGANGYCDDHSNSNKACDLMSLYDSECTQNSATCGKYLEPLGISYGATFADKYAFTYLSWATYLTDDLYESLQEFLDTFNGLKCASCKSNCSSHSSGSHGTSDGCKCRSVVECSDVLTHLYSNGFSFHNAYWLRGRDYTKGRWQENSNKRTCANFHTQLQSVISGEPLSNLLTSIDRFLYLFRYYFLSNLSAFWIIYVCIILYTFFFLLDTLHLRLHLKLTSSHTVPPLALLTSGTPLPVTKLTYIGQ